MSLLNFFVKAIVRMLRTGNLIVEMTKLMVVGTAVDLVRVLMNGGKTRPFVLKNTEKKANATINCRRVISPPTVENIPSFAVAVSRYWTAFGLVYDGLFPWGYFCRGHVQVLIGRGWGPLNC